MGFKAKPKESPADNRGYGYCAKCKQKRTSVGGKCCVCGGRLV